MPNFIRQFRARRLRADIDEQRNFYAKQRTPGEVRAWQLEQFNQVWHTISQGVPFYAALAQENKAPKQFESWEQFRAVMPISDRALIQERGSALGDRSRAADFMRTTGGSTAQPIQLPSWRSELDYGNKDLWFARSWFGIDPSDKLFLIWGHSHQLGKGFRGRLNALRRKIKDALLGYHRWSAYDLSDAAMRRAGQALMKFKPSWAMAYSVALDQFARINVDLAREFHRLKLKAAIATGESFPRIDSVDRIKNVLGCPAPMEYGAVESGPVAHQRLDGRFQLFWRHWFIESEPSANIPGAFEILLTSLYPRKFPLVRYRIGDLISDDANAPTFDQSFSRVIGRCNDLVALPDGVSIHSEAFSHAIKECKEVATFQVVQIASGKIFFRYVAVATHSVVENEIRRRLAIIHPVLRDVELQRVDSLPQTIAGKTRTIVRENA